MERKGREGITPEGDTPDDIFDLWNSFDSLKRIASRSKERIATAKLRLKDPFFIENWKAGLTAIPSTPFLLGSNDRGWTADIDWFLNSKSLPKIIEGKYNSAPSEKPKSQFAADFTADQIARHTAEHLTYCKRFNLDPDSPDANIEIPIL
jgi:hypothetical protein